MATGFRHDRKAVCELAHFRGTLVYADAVQAVGALPLNARESGIDFLACSSYKWARGRYGLSRLLRPS